MLDEIMADLRGRDESIVPGADAFRLYDTFGFPLDLTRDVAAEHGFAVDEAGFQAALDEQRARGRAAQQFVIADGEELELYARTLEDLKAQGRTVISISHDVDFCAEHFPRAVLMAQAQIILDGPAATVFSSRPLLARAAVEPPQMMRLADELDMSADPLTVDEFVDALIAERGG